MRTRPLLLTVARVAAAARQPCRSPVCPPTGSGVSYPASSSIACPSCTREDQKEAPGRQEARSMPCVPRREPHTLHTEAAVGTGQGHRSGRPVRTGDAKAGEKQPHRIPAVSTITDEDENQGLRTAAQSEENSSSTKMTVTQAKSQDTRVGFCPYVMPKKNNDAIGK